MIVAALHRRQRYLAYQNQILRKSVSELETYAFGGFGMIDTK
jgi:hypothetical protein